MRRFFRFLSLVAACLLFLPLALHGQKPGFGLYDPSTEKFGNNTLTVQAYPLFFKGYGLEYARNVYRQQHWIKVNGLCYVANSFSARKGEAIKRMIGGNVGLAHQYNYFEIPEVGFRTYFQWGISYSCFDIENVAGAKTHLEKFGLDAVVGFRQNIAKPLFFEFFIGYGQRWLLDKVIDSRGVAPSVTSMDAREPHYDRTMFEYGHSGALLVLGLNIGFLF